jgi:hypothetical protein
LPQPNTTISPALPVGPCRLASIFCTDIGLDPTSQGLLSARGTGQPPAPGMSSHLLCLIAGIRPTSLTGLTRS